jgi:hypothetical protein
MQSLPVVIVRCEENEIYQLDFRIETDNIRCFILLSGLRKNYFQRHLQTIWEKNYSYKNHNCSFCSRVFLKNTLSNRFGLGIFFYQATRFFLSHFCVKQICKVGRKKFNKVFPIIVQASFEQKKFFFALWFYCYLHI